MHTLLSFLSVFIVAYPTDTRIHHPRLHLEVSDKDTEPQHLKQMLMPVMLSDLLPLSMRLLQAKILEWSHASSLEVQNGLFHSGNQEKFRGHT